MKTKVLVNETRKYVDISIKPFVQSDLKQVTYEKWQQMINFYTELLDASVGFIMSINEKSIKEVIKSTYRRFGSRAYTNNGLKTGLYCESVIGRDNLLLVRDAQNDFLWSQNIDHTMNTNAYLGMPLKYPDGDFFGTLCFFDRKNLGPEENHIRLLEMFKDSIEKDLSVLVLNKTVEELSIIDPLTGLYNSKKMDEIIYEYQHELNRNITILSVAYIRIENFLDIRERLGDNEAEEALALLAKVIRKRSRYIDRIGRINKTDFIIISKGSDAAGQQVLLNDLEKYSKTHLLLESYKLEFKYGICEVKENEVIEEAIKTAKKHIDFNDK